MRRNYIVDEQEQIDFRLKPTKEILKEKMSLLYDFGVFDLSQKDKSLREEYATKLKSCQTILGLEKTVNDIIRDNFDKMDLLMVK